MLATRNPTLSGPATEKLRNPSLRFGGVPAKHFHRAIDKSSGNGHASSNGHGESLSAGFLLLDASLRPIYASEEALAILAYPGVPSNHKGFGNFVQSRIRSLISCNGNHNGFSPSRFVKEGASGKGSYEFRV